MQFYVLSNGEQQGPYSPEQVKGFLSLGQFQPADLAWREGLPEWKPLSDFPEFALCQPRPPSHDTKPVGKDQPRNIRHGRSVRIVAVALSIVAAIGVGSFVLWRHQHPKPAAAPGKTPLTLEELNRSYEEPPAGQNAAAFFQQGFNALQITEADSKSSLPLFGLDPTSRNRVSLPSPWSPLPGELKARLGDFIGRNQAALDLFERGSQCSGSRYPIDLRQGMTTPLPHLFKVKQAAMLAALYSLWQADRLNGTNAARGVMIALGAARTLETEPALISQLVRVANHAFTVDALEQTLNRVTLEPELLAQLQAALGRAEEYASAGDGFNRAFASERISGMFLPDLPLDKWREAFQIDGTEERSLFGDVLEKAAANPKEQCQFLEDFINRLLATRQDRFPARLAKAKDLVLARANEAKSKGYPFAAWLVTGMDKATAREATGLARLRLAQTAIALERFRAASENRYPDSLNELTPKFLPAVPADPFDGQPLRYRKQGSGYVLHSVGTDMKDDHGQRDTDAVFQVFAPPKAQ